MQDLLGWSVRVLATRTPGSSTARFLAWKVRCIPDTLHELVGAGDAAQRTEPLLPLIKPNPHHQKAIETAETAASSVHPFPFYSGDLRPSADQSSWQLEVVGMLGGDGADPPMGREAQCLLLDLLFEVMPTDYILRWLQRLHSPGLPNYLIRHPGDAGNTTMPIGSARGSAGAEPMDNVNLQRSSEATSPVSVNLSRWTTPAKKSS